VLVQHDDVDPFTPEPWSHCSALKFESTVLSPQVET
jgi:hypothetical protein